MPANAEVVARYFLHIASMVEEATPLTHLQLQKLLYYGQGWCLAMHDRPLFDGTIQAWRHGPVVREVFPKFADFAGNAIPWSESRDDGTLGKDDREVIEMVWLRYGRFSAWRLRQMTHTEPPWRKARKGWPVDEPSRMPITHDALLSFFKPLYEAQRNSPEALRFAESLKQARAGQTFPFVGE